VYSEQTVLRLVELIYGAACNPAVWPTLIEHLRQVTGASGANLSSYDLAKPRADFSHANGIVDATFQKEYLDGFMWCDPWVMAAKKAGLFAAGTIGIGEHLIPTSEVEKTAFHNDFGRRHEYTGGLTAIIRGDSVKGAALNLCRAKNHRFGQAEVDLMRTLMPHLQRALQVHDRMADLENRERAFQVGLDRLRTGALLIEQSGRVLFANEAARTILDERDGLRIDRGTLAAHRPQDTKRLRNLVGGAALTAAGERLLSGGITLLHRPSGRRALQLIVAAAPRHEGVQVFGQPCAVVFITDPERGSAPDFTLLKRVYGLSRAEAAVARLLVQGKTVHESAASLHVTDDTVRFHLKNLFSKTGTHRQADFVRMMLMNSPASGA
jgi:DNA-binding CsgD family transcriptional regulator